MSTTNNKIVLPVIRDTREKKGYDFTGYPVRIIEKALQTADYGLQGFSDKIVLERKAYRDFISIFTNAKYQRFLNELQRMKAYPVKAIVVEMHLASIVKHQYRSKVKPSTIINCIAQWYVKYNVPVFFAGNRELAEQFTFRFLYSYYLDCINYKKLIDKQLKVSMTIS